MKTISPAGRRVLAAAAELFYSEGIHAVGVDGVASRAGVTKKTLYDQFGSKDRLVALYLAERDERWRARLTAHVDRAAASGSDPLLATFDALSDWMERENPRGCAFINALAEIASPEHPAREVIARHKRWMLDYLTGLAVAAGHDEPDEAGAALLLLHEGAVVTGATGTLDPPVQHAKRAAARLIGQAGGRPGR